MPNIRSNGITQLNPALTPIWTPLFDEVVVCEAAVPVPVPVSLVFVVAGIICAALTKANMANV